MEEKHETTQEEKDLRTKNIERILQLIEEQKKARNMSKITRLIFWIEKNLLFIFCFAICFLGLILVVFVCYKRKSIMRNSKSIETLIKPKRNISEVLEKYKFLINKLMMRRKTGRMFYYNEI